MCRAVCFMCSAVCLYATPTANLQSGVQIGKATCSCARVGFRKHLVFSMKYKPQAPAEFVVARGVAARIQQFVLLYPDQRPKQKKDRSAPKLCAPNKFFPKIIRKMLGLDNLAKKKLG